MRIGYDAKRLFRNFTGLGNYSRYVVKALSSEFPENEYLLYTPELSQHPEIQPFLNVPSIRVQTPGKALDRKGLRALWRSYFLSTQATADQLDIFHGLSNELPFKKIKGSKRIVTIHDLLFVRYPHLYNLIDVGIYKRKFRWACEQADRVIAVSQQTAADITEFFKIPADKIDVVYQGCHQNFRQEYDSYILERISTKYNLPQDFLLNVGTIEPRKNALLILKALKQLKNKQPLVIVGKETDYKKELVKYARKNDLMDQVFFRHEVSFEDLPKIFQLSKIFIYPSLFEGFGIPILEALYSRVPVISSKGSCFSEAGGPHSIYINPNDPEELADAIERVQNNATMATRMIIDGAAHALNFEAPVIARNIMKVYQKTLNQ